MFMLQERLLVCYVTSPVRSILKRGTLYVNSTDDPQTLVLSTTKIAPHSVILSITTKKGTSC